MKTITDKLEKNKMLKLIEYISVFCLIMVLSMGCGQPNLDDPKVREKVLAEAIEYDKLQTRKSPSGEELRFAPNQEKPYTGWVKSDSLDVMDDISDEFDDIDTAITYDYEGDMELVQYQHGKVHGLYMSWRESSQQNCIRGTVVKGVPDGLWTGWYENGQKGFEGTCGNGLLNGKWTVWYENSQKSVKGTFLNGKMNGFWTGWHENGQKAGEGTFLNGKENGLVIEWDENGQEVSRETYKDGIGENVDTLTPLKEE